MTTLKPHEKPLDNLWPDGRDNPDLGWSGSAASLILEILSGGGLIARGFRRVRVQGVRVEHRR
jgi:hypothetical protein